MYDRDSPRTEFYREWFDVNELMYDRDSPRTEFYREWFDVNELTQIVSGSWMRLSSNGDDFELYALLNQKPKNE